jgi:hypothetical protein
MAWDDPVEDNVTIDTAENHNARTTEIKRKVQGPDASTEGMVAKWDGTTGRVLKDSLAFVSDDGGIYIPLGQHFNEGGSEHVHAVPKLDDCAAPDDNTDLNATTSAHGLLKKLPGDNTQYMNGAGNWSTPSGGEGTSDHAALSHLAYADAGHTGFAPIDNPTFTGTPAAPTAAVRTNTTQLATTAFVLKNIGYSDIDDIIIFNDGGTYRAYNNTLGEFLAETSTTDAAVVINAALVDLAGARGSIGIRAGSYTILQAITIPEPAIGVRIHGAGAIATDITANNNGSSTAYYAIQVVGGVSGDDYITISDLRLLKGTAHTNSVGIYISGYSGPSEMAEGLRIENIHVEGFLKGFSLNLCAFLHITNCYAKSCGTGFYNNMCWATNMIGCYTTGCTLYGYYFTGLVVGGSGWDEGTYLTNCHSIICNYGIYLNQKDYVNVSNCSFTDAVSGGIALVYSGKVKINGCECNANNSTTPSAPGITMDENSSENIISGCNIMISKPGISIYGSDNNIIGCNFKYNNDSDVLLSGGSNTVVSSNACASTYRFEYFPCQQFWKYNLK